MLYIMFIHVISKHFILCVYSHYMGQMDIYIRNEEKIILIRKANKFGVSVSKLMVTSALMCDEEVMEEIKHGK